MRARSFRLVLAFGDAPVGEPGKAPIPIPIPGHGSFRRILPCGGLMPVKSPVAGKKSGFPLRVSRFPSGFHQSGWGFHPARGQESS